MAAFDRDTGKAKGFCHIQFESVEAAAKAIGMSGQTFGSRDIFIDTAQERTGGGGGGAGGAAFERPQRSKPSMHFVLQVCVCMPRVDRVLQQCFC